MPLSIVDIMNFTNYFSVLSRKIKDVFQATKKLRIIEILSLLFVLLSF